MFQPKTILSTFFSLFTVVYEVKTITKNNHFCYQKIYKPLILSIQNMVNIKLKKQLVITCNISQLFNK